MSTASLTEKTVEMDLNLDFSLKSIFSPEFGMDDLDLLDVWESG
jgi:hypothetical protein